MSTSPWYESFFDERYMLLFDRALNESQADRDATFIERALTLPKGARILDVGCGYGRHAIALAKLGYDVVGVDVSDYLLSLARDRSATENVSVQWVQGDMRSLPQMGLGTFDACVCLHTAFGVFDDAGNERALLAMRDILRPEGHLMIDVMNPVPRLRLVGRLHYRETSKGIVRERYRYNALAGVVTTDRMFFGFDGSRVEFPASLLRFYMPSELRAILSAHFEIEGLFGALDDVPFAFDRSPIQVFVATRK
jgi:SAM-dependent methyltransferase